MSAQTISPEAVARREAARQGGKFGTQAHSAPDADVLSSGEPSWGGDDKVLTSGFTAEQIGGWLDASESNDDGGFDTFDECTDTHEYLLEAARCMNSSPDAPAVAGVQPFVDNDGDYCGADLSVEVPGTLHYLVEQVEEMPDVDGLAARDRAIVSADVLLATTSRLQATLDSLTGKATA